MTPEEVAAQIAESFDRDAVNLPYLVTDAYGNEFYVSVHNPGEGNQRFAVTVTECTDIQT